MHLLAVGRRGHADKSQQFHCPTKARLTGVSEVFELVRRMIFYCHAGRAADKRIIVFKFCPCVVERLLAITRGQILQAAAV